MLFPGLAYKNTDSMCQQHRLPEFHASRMSIKAHISNSYYSCELDEHGPPQLGRVDSSSTVMFTSAYPEANFPLEPVIQPSTNSATAFAASTEPRFKCGFVASCNVASRAVSGNVSVGAADAKVGAATSEQLVSKCMLADTCSCSTGTTFAASVWQADIGTYCNCLGMLQVQVCSSTCKHDVLGTIHCRKKSIN